MNSSDFKYYKRYSGDRYNLTQLTHGTSFLKKQYGFTGHKIEPNNTEVFKLIQGLMDHSLKIVRFDVLSRYQDHNHSPSTRNMHSAQVLFIIDKKYIFYDLYEDVFIVAGHCSVSGISTDKIYIFGFSDLINISRYYGEFSFYLSILDAGHVLGNLKNYLNSKVFKWTQMFKIMPVQILKDVCFYSCEMFGTFLLSVVRPEGDLNINSQVAHKRIAEDKSFSELEATEYLKLILPNVNNKMLANRKDKVQSNVSNFPYLPQKRNSAHNMVGNFNLTTEDTISDLELQNQINNLNAFQKNITSLKQRYCFLRKDKIFYDSGEVKNSNVNFKNILYDDHEFFDLNTFNLICVIYSNDIDVQTEGVINSLLSCGELMQVIGLALSNSGKSFRPMKNYNDNYLKSILKLNANAEINYIGVECSNPVEQISEFYD
ncbi:hypothetical protein HCA99_16495 [Listeria booriae]|uniref:hypothetical protein n=1 Tax=Listeria booriae TaxID=1552123 RepID=UPI001625825A|nr:hypothetical protein [Listeria booriae]MBC2080832.1 hypothetical protein [Listeria booriae]